MKLIKIIVFLEILSQIFLSPCAGQGKCDYKIAKLPMFAVQLTHQKNEIKDKQWVY